MNSRTDRKHLTENICNYLCACCFRAYYYWSNGRVAGEEEDRDLCSNPYKCCSINTVNNDDTYRQVARVDSSVPKIFPKEVYRRQSGILELLFFTSVKEKKRFFENDVENEHTRTIIVRFSFRHVDLKRLNSIISLRGGNPNSEQFHRGTITYNIMLIEKIWTLGAHFLCF